jgi:asparagine synthase (glutamine-hydrolysing)
MLAAMNHRGPDDEGLVAIDPQNRFAPEPLAAAHTSPDVFGARLPYAPQGSALDPRDRALVLGQVRLAIIDLSPGGHQPMCNADGSIWVVFGGEIFNYLELRDELTARGHHFRSACDTEVIVEGWAEWGEDLFRRMNGMWMIVLWDARQRRLVGARDRMGVKPLYYRYRAGEFSFASELRGLLALGPPMEPDPDSIRQLILEGRVDTGERTFFTGIRSFRPAHFGVVGAREIAFTRFWGLPEQGKEGGQWNGGGERSEGKASAAALELRRLLTDAVRLRLRSDVRVGTCLSGGIDSSAIVALGTSLLGGPMDAYSIAYDEGPEFDERPHMAAVCAATGARHHLAVPRGENLLDELIQVTVAQEEPTAGPGVYSQWHVMRLAHANGAKVLLDGQGADELFGGYFAFYYPLRLRHLIASGDMRGAAVLARAALARGHSAVEVAARTAEPWLPPALFRFGRAWFGAGEWGRVLGPALRRRMEPQVSAPGAPHPGAFADPLTRRQADDLCALLLPSLLRYEDRNSMAFSIEARVPFLDYRVVELAFSLPPAAKIDQGITKKVLREAMSAAVPASILARTDKRGFETPVVRWLLSRHADWLAATLVRGRAVERGFLDPHVVASELARQVARPHGPGHELWRLLSLELWLRAVVERKPQAVAEMGERAGGKGE